MFNRWWVILNTSLSNQHFSHTPFFNLHLNHAFIMLILVELFASFKVSGLEPLVSGSVAWIPAGRRQDSFQRSSSFGESPFEAMAAEEFPSPSPPINISTTDFWNSPGKMVVVMKSKGKGTPAARLMEIRESSRLVNCDYSIWPEYPLKMNLVRCT